MAKSNKSSAGTDQQSKAVDEQAKDKQQGGGGSTSTTEAEAGGPSGGTGAGSTETTDASGKSPEVPVLEEKPKRAPRKASVTHPKKGKISAKQKKEMQQQQNIEQTALMMQGMIQAVSTIVSLRAGKHWQLTEQEAESIANPLARIMARHSLDEKMSEWGDYMALGVAAGMAVIPRMIYHNQMKGMEKDAIKPNNPTTNRTGAETSTSDGGTGRKPASATANPAYVQTDAEQPYLGPAVASF